jgi:hypothetical protein
MTAGGMAFKICCVRVGRKVIAKKSSWRRTYNNDGTYKFIQTPENLLRVEGQEYFKNTELKATSEGTDKDPKFSLLKHYQECEIPKLDKLTSELSAIHNCKVVVRYQYDGAGPHTDKKLVAYLNDEFLSRGWMFVPQPPNSPHVNVQDMSIFPAMSKAVTWQRILRNVDKVLEGEELNDCVQNAWNNLSCATIARAYLHHHQIVNAIARDEGGDDFIKEKGGLHCGVRKHAVHYFDNEESTEPSGVYVVDEVCESADDTLLAQTPIDPITGTRRWKYPVPQVSQYNPLEYLNVHEKNCLVENLPISSHLWESMAVDLLCGQENMLN